MLFQPPLPPPYSRLSEREMCGRICAHKAAFGRRLVILGHHYQQDDVIQFADFTGDSLKLSQLAARQADAEFVVFCGVHFMAESADILTHDDVAVILPDLSAGCSMADMAMIDQVEDAWDRFAGATDEKIIPITYVNSTADVKAFCGRHDGACCTSSNARKVLEYALTQGDKVLFLPDQHLGRNTAYALGNPLESMVVYDPHADDGGLTDEQVLGARFILWKGHCSVHQLFTEQHCEQVRRSDPARRILVHPECRWEVVQRSDLAGSTEYILKVLEEAPEGTSWAVGTEAHLVNRLAMRYAGRKYIRSLAGIQCLCTTMYRIDLPHLTWSLDELAAGRVVNRIKVDPDTCHHAIVALQRMLDNVSATPVSAK
ncbi:MAG: quinolinate synthase NadA [Planctomycetes bacterium]|nr:quinolinate synthase NadA [Planctomycetota bacterium]